VEQIKKCFWGVFPTKAAAKKYLFVMQVKSIFKGSKGKKK